MMLVFGVVLWCLLLDIILLFVIVLVMCVLCFEFRLVFIWFDSVGFVMLMIESVFGFNIVCMLLIIVLLKKWFWWEVLIFELIIKIVEFLLVNLMLFFEVNFLFCKLVMFVILCVLVLYSFILWFVKIDCILLNWVIVLICVFVVIILMIGRFLNCMFFVIFKFNNCVICDLVSGDIWLYVIIVISDLVGESDISFLVICELM